MQDKGGTDEVHLSKNNESEDCIDESEVMRFYRRLHRELSHCMKFRAYMNEDRRLYLERHVHIWNNLTQEEALQFIRKYIESMRVKDKKRKRCEEEHDEHQINVNNDEQPARKSARTENIPIQEIDTQS